MPRSVQCPQCQFVFTLADDAPRDAADCPNCRVTFRPRTYSAWLERHQLTSSVTRTLLILVMLGLGVLVVLGILVEQHRRQSPVFSTQVAPGPVGPGPIPPNPPMATTSTTIVRSTDLGQLIQPGLPILPVRAREWVRLNGVPELRSAQVNLAPPPREGGWRVEFESAIGQVVSAGAGRFLIVHLPEVNQLAIFDGNAGKVTHTIALDPPATVGARPRMLIAAGAADLVVAHAGRLTHYDLATGKKGRSVMLSSRVDLLALAMHPSAADGPLLVGFHDRSGNVSNSRWLLGSPKTLQAWNPPNANGLGLSPRALVVGGMAAAGGAAAGGTASTQAALLQYDPSLARLSVKQLNGQEEPPHLRQLLPSQKVNEELLVFSGNSLTTYPMNDQEPSGRSFFTGRQALRLQLRGPRVLNETPPDFEMELPAVDDWRVLVLASDARGRRLTLQVSEQVQVPLGDWPAEADPRPAAGSPIPLEQRAFFLPKNQLLVTIPAGDRRLVVQRLDLDAALANVRWPGPVVISQPPLVAPTQCRQTMVYPIRCLPANARLTYQILRQPPGPASIDDTGTLRWEPTAAVGTLGEFAIRITDDQQRATDHTFRIVHAPPLSAPPAPVPPAPVPPALPRDGQMPE
jgi:hypothetical protein